ncbi:MAG: DUF928 domain-containing protein [Nostoc sp. NOS(2021)]|uniref:DUF928 domain-containing protein n=1 Tax=Nostoc sp. NOS(2021) TaxID=2815407 RepID=UPI0025F204C8|nr:DUF928 domain-containing protein [Nostoc sp. NOS(2021)]MBN3899810.1 DUF928 domain-containing protein [Nostoc sp. NOS(2021)]
MMALKLQRLQSWQISQKFIPPNRKAPQTTAGGATRGGSCYLEGKETLTALMPLNKSGLTLAERPTFYWFVPQIPEETAHFSLLDGEDIVYETTFKLPKQLGIIGFTLPTKAPSLQVGKNYHWYMSIACGSEEVGEGITVDGWVERIQPTTDLSKQLARTNPKQLSQVYATSGIWYEVLDTLVQQRLTDPGDRTVMANWKALLESVGLNNLVSKPLVNSWNAKTN